MKLNTSSHYEIGCLTFLMLIINGIGIKYFDWGFLEFAIVLSWLFILGAVVRLDAISGKCTKTHEEISEIKEEIGDVNRTLEVIGQELELLRESRN